jgi:hypothetical protein
MPRLVVSGAVFFAVALVAGLAIGLSAGENKSTAPAAAVQLQPTPIPGIGFAQLMQADDLEMALSVSPGLVGRNDVNYYVRDTNGDDRPYTKLVTRFSYLDGRAEPLTIEPVQLHEGHWPIEALELKLAGRWQIDVTVSRDGIADTLLRYEIALPHP